MTEAAARRTALDGVAIATLLICCTIWGLNQVAVKVALADVPALSQVAIRSLGATLLVLAWARWRGVPMAPRNGTWRGGLLAGVLFAAEFACIFIGLQHTSASRMAVFLYLSPFVVALGMPFIARGERLNGLQWTGLLVAFAGVAVAFAEGLTQPSAGPRQWLGDALGVLAAALWGATTLVVRASRLSSAPAEQTLVYQLAVSGLLMLAVALLVGPVLPVAPSPLSWASLVFQTVVVTAASYLAWFWLIARYPATRLATFTLLTPVAGLVFGAVLLSEPLTVRLVLGLATVVAGIVLVNRR